MKSELSRRDVVELFYKNGKQISIRTIEAWALKKPSRLKFKRLGNGRCVYDRRDVLKFIKNYY